MMPTRLISKLMSTLAACRRKMLRVGLLGVVLLAPLAARADEETPKPDGRLEGYAGNVALNEGGTGLTTVFLIILAVVSVGVMFINAKRSHLD